MMRIGERRRERGAELVETALLVPLLLVILAIVADLGRAYFAYIAVIDAAREGARYGVAHQSSTEMCAAALSEAADQFLPVALSCVADPGNGPGTPVKATVSCDLPLIMGPLVGRSSILISHTAAFRIR